MSTEVTFLGGVAAGSLGAALVMALSGYFLFKPPVIAEPVTQHVQLTAIEQLTGTSYFHVGNQMMLGACNVPYGQIFSPTDAANIPRDRLVDLKLFSDLRTAEEYCAAASDAFSWLSGFEGENATSS